MIRKVLQAFADENFDNKHYPVLQWTNANPFVLMVKKKRNILKRPLTKSEFKIIAGLEYYVKEDKKEEFLECVKAKKRKESDLEIEKYDENDGPAESYTEIGLKAADVVDGNLKIIYDLGELELGKLDKEYFNHPDLKSILQGTELDTEKMKEFANQKLHLIYSVIYSERFELKGKRGKEVEAGVGANAPGVSIFTLLKAKAKVHVKRKFVPPKPAKRKKRGPVYYKSVSVDYDEAEGRLKLPPGTFVGESVNRDVGDEDDADNSEIVLAFEDEGSDLAASLMDEDFKKLEIIKKAVLLKSEDREKRKERVKKYLNWFEEALTTDNLILSLPDDKPLTDEDRDFLQRIYCQAPPGNNNTVNLSSLKTADKIQGYAIVLKLIDDLTDEQWEEIEKAWAEPDQDE